jgi:hypothetical protein
MIANKNWYVLLLVLLFITISIFVILWSVNIFNSFLNNEEIWNMQIEANIDLDNQYKFFKQYLIYTNTDGLWYMADLPDRSDINNDDDDFNWLQNDTDWMLDDDGDAFKYKLWLVSPWQNNNILLLDQNYFNYSNFNYATLTWVSIYTDKSAKYKINIFDWNTYSEQWLLKLRNSVWGVISPGENFINTSTLWINVNDILAIYLDNYTDEALSYKIKWVWLNWNDINYFLPVIATDKNFSLYTSTLIKDKNGLFLIFSKIYRDILDWWRRPIAPSYLQWYWSWNTLYLNWEINDLTNTGAYYLFRWKDDTVACSEEYFLAKIDNWYKENSFSWDINIAGSFYYTICRSNSSWWTWFTNPWKLSTNSNIINIIK